jgi:DNA repair photolyase
MSPLMAKEIVMSIYEPQGRAREYSPLALNYFRGCDNGCKYCYVPPMMVRFNKNYCHETVLINVDFEKIEKSAKKMEGCNKQILLSFTTDPYCNAESGETNEVLRILNKYNHKVAILTKNPNKAMRDVYIFKKFGDRLKIGSTLVFNNPKDCNEWEGGAEVSEIRISALNEYKLQGIKTWASFEPVIDPKQSLSMLKKASEFIDHVKIGKINNYQGMDKNIDWAQFIHDSVAICRDSNLKFYVKKDLIAFNKTVFLSGKEVDEDALNL